MNICCVLINYNDSKRVTNLSNKLVSFDFFTNIVVVDNGSKEKEIEYLKDNLKDNDVIQVLYTNNNNGYSLGSNIGFQFLEGKECEYVFTINSDIDVDVITLRSLIDFLEKNEEYGASSCIMEEYGKIKNAYYNFPTVHDENMQSLGLRKIFKGKCKPNKIYDNYMDVDYIRASLCCFRFKTLKQIGYFDTNTFMYYLEAIAAKKLLDIGYKEAVLLNYKYQHNHIYGKNKIKLLKIAHKDKIYAFNTYFKVNKFNMYRLNFCFQLGVLMRRISGMK